MSELSAAATLTVFPEDPTWFPCCGEVAQISGTNPRSGTGSVELANNGAFIGHQGTPFGTYGTLEYVKLDWFIQSFTDPGGFNQSLPPEIAVRFYNYDETGTFFLHWDTCSFAAGCDPQPVGSWRTTTLTRAQLALQEAEGNPLPATIPDDAPIQEVHLRASYSFGGPWSGFVDNVTLKFTGQDPITYNFEVHAVPEPKAWLLIGVGLLLVLRYGRRPVPGRPQH
jgi:hypothetical protein